MLCHDGDLQRPTSATAKRAGDQPKKHAHQHWKTNDEEHSEPVPPHQRQVFDRHRENAAHQSRKLLPVRVKKTLIAEAHRDAHEEVAERIADAIAAENGVPLHEVVLVEPRSVPKTPSGKIQRFRCREAWQRRTLERVA